MPTYAEPSFVVFYSMLLQLFNIFCFKCKEPEPKVSMKKNGTMVTVTQHCRKCGENSFVWTSQPLVFGRYPLGNMLLSFGILIAGATVNKVLLIFKHMGLCVYSSRTFFSYQRKFLFPAVLAHWKKQKESLLAEVKKVKDAAWSGDGRYDSMGHSAKFGTYTMLCNSTSKIVHFEVVQVRCFLIDTALGRQIPDPWEQYTEQIPGGWSLMELTCA